ncbi:hypothetical protein GDO86_009748 [Hymenochirus boettgeri]|uniref:Osteopetrosis associated transmembrane protein 1 n=1 Tax=Hymenochirus boettgeri TaxID=247094 RepID=A0A8T2JHF6_9PIPI|nr:hypothetical protein GDO86_009748 [Hymenochirus boettgeri]
MRPLLWNLLLCGVCFGSYWEVSEGPVGSPDVMQQYVWAEELSLSLLPSYSIAPALNPDPAICSTLQAEFASQAANLSSCLVTNARPVRLCQECYHHYVQLQSTMQNIESPMQMVQSAVLSVYFSSDRVQVIVILKDFFNSPGKIQSAYVECLQNQSEGLLNTTSQFMGMFRDLVSCFNNNRKVSAEQTLQGNFSGICKNCSKNYKDLNDLYSRLEKAKALCIDLEDAMNSTRTLWSKTFNCTVPCTDTVPVIAVSAFILFLPIVFYLSSYLHSEQKKRKLIFRKRTAQSYSLQKTTQKD